MKLLKSMSRAQEERLKAEQKAKEAQEKVRMESFDLLPQRGTSHRVMLWQFGIDIAFGNHHVHFCNMYKHQMHIKCSNAQMHKCQMHKCQLHKCSNAQLPKCSNAQMHKCSNAQLPKCSNAQMPNAKCSNAQMLKCQMLKCSNAKCSNAQMLKCQMPSAQMLKRSNAQTLNCC